MTDEERREMMRNNYAAQMDMLGYHPDGNPKDLVEVVQRKKPKKYHVTIDGYVCTGNSAPAEYLGVYTASSPKAACQKALKNNGYDMSYWDSSRCTWWGCKVTAEEQEPKNGKWIILTDCANEGIYCSNCSAKIFEQTTIPKTKLSNFCPNCGSKNERFYNPTTKECKVNEEKL